MHSSLLVAIASLAAISQALPSPYQSELVSRAASSKMCFAKTPSPSSLKCSTTGSVSNGSILKNSKATNANREDSCRDGCESLKTCKAFSWDPFAATGGCVYYKKPVSQMGFTGSNGPYFSDRGCYTCTACAITLQNGDFESGSVQPWNSISDNGDDLSIVSPGAGGSNKALQVVVPSHADDPMNNGGGFTQDFGQCMGKNYTVSFDYKVTSYAANTMLVLWHEAGNYQEVPKALYMDFNPQVGDWKHASFTFAPDFNNYGYITFKMIGRDNNRATYQYDNIAIVPTAA